MRISDWSSDVCSSDLPGYLEHFGRPGHPGEILAHACLRFRFDSGVMPLWEFVRKGDTLKVDPPAKLIVQARAAVDLAIESAIAGAGIIYLFEDWLRPYLDRGELEPVLAEWRSEERRGGEEGVSKCRYRWWPYN